MFVATEFHQSLPLFLSSLRTHITTRSMAMPFCGAGFQQNGIYSASQPSTLQSGGHPNSPHNYKFILTRTRLAIILSLFLFCLVFRKLTKSKIAIAKLRNRPTHTAMSRDDQFAYQAQSSTAHLINNHGESTESLARPEVAYQPQEEGGYDSESYPMQALSLGAASLSGSVAAEPVAATDTNQTLPTRPQPAVIRRRQNTLSSRLQSWLPNENLQLYLQALDQGSKNYLWITFTFYLAILIVWVVSTTNRVYSLIWPGEASKALLLGSAIVLPMQGLFNGILFHICGRRAIRDFLSKRSARKHAARILKWQNKPFFCVVGSTVVENMWAHDAALHVSEAALPGLRERFPNGRPTRRF